MDTQLDYERRANLILAKHRRLRAANPRLRPFGVEWCGDPKAGKSSMKMEIQKIFKRSDWHVSARPEGAEWVDHIPRDKPDYNDLTLWYALTQITERQGVHFDLVMLDRGPTDHLVWQRYWRSKGLVDDEEVAIAERYCMLKRIREKLDIRILMVCDPEISLERETAGSLTSKEGETMNIETLRKLHGFHMELWEKHRGDPCLIMHDTSKETPKQTTAALNAKIVEAFERRLKTLK